MDLQTFLNLSGLKLTSAQEDSFPRVAAKAERKLTSLLGWHLTQKSLFEEVGKTGAECQCIDQTLSEDQWEQFIERLQEPDEEEGMYRLFPYSNKDTRLFIDPALAVYKVKLVVFARGSDQQFITIKTFKNWMPILNHNAFVDGSAKVYAHYIELCKDDWNLPCGCSNCVGCAYLAVDGDWLRNIYPEDLQDLLVDLIVQEYQQPYSLNADSSRIVEQESVSNHSVKYLITDKDRRGESTSRVQDNEWFINNVMPWIGPYSPLYKKIRLY